MSRILTSNDFYKTWNAPKLGIKSDNDYDFKVVNAENVSEREQQELIRQQSYEKSYARGYMEGLAQGQREIQEQVNHLGSLMAALSMPLPEIDDRVVDELVLLSMAVARQMVRRELKMSPEMIVSVVKEALSTLPATEAEVTLELHPQDAKLIRENLVHPGSEPHWNIVENSLLTRGGCRVSTDTSRIDATVEKRMNKAIAEVIGGERREDQDHDD